MTHARRLPFFAAFLVLLLTLGFGCKRDAGPIDGPTELWSTYTSSRFRVSFKHPTHWKATAGTREDDSFTGANGFVYVSAAGGAKVSVAQAVLNETRHKLMPYGTAPTVLPTRVSGQEGRIILPSDDQPPEMKRQGLLLAVYPKPVHFSSETYHFFLLYADKDHLLKIARTLRFLDAAEAAKSAVAGSVTLGPCANQKSGKACEFPTGYYSDRKMVVYQSDGTTKVKEVPIDAKGLYRAELEAGTYMIDINHVGIDRSADVPKRVTIDPGKTLVLDIYIDLGVR